MTGDPIYFGPFTLDRTARQLVRDGTPVALNPRYFDALSLLAASPGELMTKDRFMAEVWRGIPVTDEALTQCIRTLRRVLGDDAAAPRFIQTVPKYGYRFVGQASTEGGAPTRSPTRAHAFPTWPPIVASGVGGGALAGAGGGLVYGLMVSALGPQSASGVSLVLVLMLIAMVIATIAATAVCTGIALAARRGVGSLAAHVGGGAALIGAASGLVTSLLGGKLFAGSLAALGDSFAGSRLDLHAFGLLLGEPGFGPFSEAVASIAEGAIFIVGICWAVRRFSQAARP